MGKVKAWYMQEMENVGLAGGGVFDDYVDDEVRSMEEEYKSGLHGGVKSSLSSSSSFGSVVRDEYDLWVTHDGEGDN